MLVVVLGMHRSGTSLVSSMLHAMGVKMGEQIHLERRDPDSQPQGYWEDQDFTSLNRQIIMAAKGHWHRPPTREVILKAARAWDQEMGDLIERKQRAMESENLTAQALRTKQWVGWGWKDPRNCLTIEAWWRHLADLDVRFMRVQRDMPAITDSLIRRGEQLGGVPEFKQRAAWVPVINDHEQRITNFLLRSGALCIDVKYEHLTNEGGHIAPLSKMIDLLGLEDGEFIEAVRAGAAKIQFRG